MFQPDGNQLWSLGRSLWTLITESVSQSEVLTIQTALGYSLVDKYSKLHAEAEMWHKSWQMSHQGGSRGSRAETPLTHPQGSPLADPPAVKELARAEVKMLLQTLRERVCKEGRGGEDFLIRYKPELVNYALSHRDVCYTNHTTVPTGDTKNGSRPRSRCSVQPSAEQEIDAVRDKLNITGIHEVAGRLRSRLLGECEALTTMIYSFKVNRKKNVQSQGESDKYEPSLSELRELREAVQLDLGLFSRPLATPSRLPVKGLKNMRLSSEQSTDSLPGLRGAPPLCHLIPRPPSGPPPTHASPSRTHSFHRLTPISNKSHKHPTCNSKDTSGLASSPLSAKQKTVKSKPLSQHTVLLQEGHLDVSQRQISAIQSL